MYNRRPRLQGFLYTGFRRYFLTFCTDGRHKVFTNPSTVACVREQILSAAHAQGVAILAYVFMPDHVHLLVEGKREDADLKSFVHLAKQKSGFAYSRSHHRRLWQASYFDRMLRDEEDTWDVIRYIVMNPVRANLVTTFTQYAFLGSAVMERDELMQELAAIPATQWQPAKGAGDGTAL
ncbi:MAG: transposase [Acidobacteria bacterium]|nr:transposase [Acidobacteriota bacterium]